MRCYNLYVLRCLRGLSLSRQGVKAACSVRLLCRGTEGFFSAGASAAGASATGASVATVSGATGETGRELSGDDDRESDETFADSSGTFAGLGTGLGLGALEGKRIASSDGKGGGGPSRPRFLSWPRHERALLALSSKGRSRLPSNAGFLSGWSCRRHSFSASPEHARFEMLLFFTKLRAARSP